MDQLLKQLNTFFDSVEGKACIRLLIIFCAAWGANLLFGIGHFVLILIAVGVVQSTFAVVYVHDLRTRVTKLEADLKYWEDQEDAPY